MNSDSSECAGHTVESVNGEIILTVRDARLTRAKCSGGNVRSLHAPRQKVTSTAVFVPSYPVRFFRMLLTTPNTGITEKDWLI
jgi:hypothetical protein